MGRSSSGRPSRSAGRFGWLVRRLWGEPVDLAAWRLPLDWALVLSFVVLWGAIRPEERYLHGRFGAPYDDYARRVRRWL